MKILIASDASDGAKAALADLVTAGMPEKTEAVVMTASDIPPGLLDASTPEEPAPAMLANAKAGRGATWPPRRSWRSKGCSRRQHEICRPAAPGKNLTAARACGVATRGV